LSEDVRINFLCQNKTVRTIVNHFCNINRFVGHQLACWDDRSLVDEILTTTPGKLNRPGDVAAVIDRSFGIASLSGLIDRQS
jgi:hypothetical protein